MSPKSVPTGALLGALALLLVSLPVAPAAAQAAGAGSVDRLDQQSAVYRGCLERARADPKTAYATALAWHGAGGGLPARHCAAIALAELGDHAEAAARLERLAGEVAAEEARIRARLLAQAAQAWDLSGRYDRAELLQSELLAAYPNDRGLRVDRALTRLSAGRVWDAVDDLNLALEQQPEDPEVLLYRAAAYRYLDALELAREDVDRAIALDPDRPEAWLERGILRQFDGDLEGARRDWAEVLRLEPDGSAAAAARARIERLSVVSD